MKHYRKNLVYYVRECWDWTYKCNREEFGPVFFTTTCQWAEWFIQIAQYMEATYGEDEHISPRLPSFVEKYYN